MDADRVRQWMGKPFGYDPEMGDGPLIGGSGGFGAGPQAYPPGFIGPVSPGSTRNAPPPSSGNPYKDWSGQGHQRTHLAPSQARAPTPGWSTTPPRQPPRSVALRIFRRPLVGWRTCTGSRRALVGTPYSTQVRNDCSGMSQSWQMSLWVCRPIPGQGSAPRMRARRLAGDGFSAGHRWSE